MAERRMFAKAIIDSDAFLDMPLSTQALYFHLSMRADDEGFVGNPKKIQRMIGASDDDTKLLVMKRFILTFDSGIIVSVYLVCIAFLLGGLAVVSIIEKIVEVCKDDKNKKS